MTRPNPQRSLTAAAAAAALTLIAIGAPKPADASLQLDLTCTAEFTVYFSPPLFAGGTSTITSPFSMSACLFPNGTNSDLHSGTGQTTGVASAAPNLDPCSLILTMTDSGPVNWSPANATSILTGTINTNPAAGTIGITASVTGGRMNGDTVTTIPVLATVNPDCLTNGLKKLTSPATQLIFHN